MKAGWTINNMPTNPKKTADHRLIPTFSDKKKIEATVTNIGPPKVSDTTSAKGNSLRPINKAIIAKAPVTALNACKPGLSVL